MLALWPCAVSVSMTFLKEKKKENWKKGWPATSFTERRSVRIFLRVSALIECDMGVPLDWLRGRLPVMPLRLFKAR